MLTRSTLIRLSQEKLSDARLLVREGRWSNGYYLYGYAVEIALKAIIARSFRADEIPDRRLVESVYTHDLSRLIVLAGLEIELTDRRVVDDFARRWSVVLKWNEAARYRIIGQAQSEEMAEAVDDPQDGAFAWLETHLQDGT